MSPLPRMLRPWLPGVLVGLLTTGCGPSPPPLASPAPGLQPEGTAFHVRPGEEIQPALDAASLSSIKRVIVHAGEYRPQQPAQALIWLHGQHDGLQVEAEGEVVLRADNEAKSDPGAPSHPAIVNHVVYFGDGISPKTVFRGFRITGARSFVTRAEPPVIQPETGVPQLEKKQFFYSDGGGIKIFGRSYPTIENCEVFQNEARPCGGGVSIEHRGFHQEFARFRNCVFRENVCQLTGSAVDVLPSSAAELVNCLFVDNVGNRGVDDVSPAGESYNAEHGSGALTVFPGSRVRVERCTFTGNWNGVDDKGRGNTYSRCIFWKNTRPGGLSPGGRYEFDILHAVNVDNSAIGGGETSDLRGTLDPGRNLVDAPDPQFDAAYVPHAPEYAERGYRPVTKASSRSPASP